MGDKYEIDVDCVYCGHTNKGVWYAPTSSSDTFKCENCKMLNFITLRFKAKKVADVTIDDVRDGFLNTTMGTLTDEEIDDCCQEHLFEIKKQSKEEK